MKIDTLEEGTIVLREVYNSIVLETVEGNRLAVCMRDAGFEIGVGDSITKDDYTWYSAGNGCVEPLAPSNALPEPLASLNYESSPRISAMLRSKTEGFFDKERFPVPDDFVFPEPPALGSRWEIDAEYDPSKGPRNAYTVLFVTNLDHLSSKYPPQVVYRGDNGRLWSRPLGKWPGRLRRIPSVADLVIAGVERPFSERDQQDLEAVAEAAISYGQENPLRVADGCDPEFMAALERGDHLRAAGATEEQIAKVKEIGKKFPFSGADQIDLGMCEELVETSQYQQDGYTSCGAVAVAIVDGRPKCALHARRVDKNDTQRSPS